MIVEKGKMDKVGAMLYAQRQMMGAPQRVIAKQAHTSIPMYCRFERGDSIPRLDALVDICDALGLVVEIRRPD